MYGQVPEPEIPEFVGRPLFLETVGGGKAGVPLAIRPFLAEMYADAASMVMCSMMSSLEFAAEMISFVVSGWSLRWCKASCGFAEKKIGISPCAMDPSNMSALSGNEPSRTETALSLLKYFFWMNVGAAGRPCISSLGNFSESAATAHRRLAPT